MICGARLWPSCTFSTISVSALMVAAVVKPAPGPGAIVGDLLELAGGDTSLETGAYFRARHLAHTPAQGIDVESTFVYDGLALEALIAGEGDSLPYLAADAFVWRDALVSVPFLRARASATTRSA